MVPPNLAAIKLSIRKRRRYQTQSTLKLVKSTTVCKWHENLNFQWQGCFPQVEIQGKLLCWGASFPAWLLQPRAMWTACLPFLGAGSQQSGCVTAQLPGTLFHNETKQSAEKLCLVLDVRDEKQKVKHTYLLSHVDLYIGQKSRDMT